MNNLETSETTLKLKSNSLAVLWIFFLIFYIADDIVKLPWIRLCHSKTANKIMRNILAIQIWENIPFKNQWIFADPTFASSISLVRPFSEM